MSAPHPEKDMQPIRSIKQAGLTLVELMFAVAIVAVLASIASTSVFAAVHAARGSDGLAHLVAALARARDVATNTEVEVVLCPSTDGQMCAEGYHWESGWIAFQATHSGSDRQPEGRIVLRQGPLPPKVHLITTQGRTRIKFLANGGNVGSNATFTFCDGRGARSASAYALSNAGNLRAVPAESGNVSEACIDG
jgi:type IV fimbrial biogenesis protein FimT